MAAESAVLQWHVLGPFEVTADGCPVDLGGPQLRSVLARLVVVPGRTVSVAALAAELWSEGAPAHAHRTVRTYLSKVRATLRRAVGVRAEEMLVTRAPGYQLRLDPTAVDAVRFERLAASGRQATEAQQPLFAIQRLTAALDLWCGDAFAEFARHPTVSAEGVRLDRLRLVAVEARIEAALTLGLNAQVASELEGLVRTHPTRERLWEQLMTALYRSGRQVEALDAFRTVRTVLIRDHGVEPSPRLAEIHRQVLHHDVKLTRTAPRVHL